MVSTVRPRPNYYETLGITPTAASDEIAKAFAKATSVFRPHAFGAITEACLAYETLRHPTKRRAYDASLGLNPEPAPPVSSTTPRQEPPLPRPASPYPVDRTSSPAAQASTPEEHPTPRPEAAGLTLDSFSTLQRQPFEQNASAGSPAPVLNPEPPQPAIDDKPPLAPQIGGDVSHQLSLEEQFGVEASPIDWRRIGIATGAVAGAACLLGVVAGWWSAGDIGKAQQPKESASPPFSLPDQDAEPESLRPALAPPVMEARPDRSRRAAVASARVDGTPAVLQLAEPEEQPQTSHSDEGQTLEGQSEPSEVETNASEQEALTDPLAPSVAATLPLPNKVIARTIERIGYSCGAVTSSSQVEGEAPGVYKINCASGQSYQARPVNGRYRFRRWGRQ